MKLKNYLSKSIICTCILINSIVFFNINIANAEVYKQVSVGVDVGAILSGAFKSSDISGEAVGIGNEPQSMLPNTNLPGQREGEISPYYENNILAIVRTDKGYALLNTFGEIITPNYKEIIPNTDGTYSAKTEDKKWIRLDKRGQLNSDSNFVSSNENSNNLIIYKDDKTKKYGFKDSTGNIIIPAKFREVLTNFSDDCAFVKNAEGKKVAINSLGNEIFVAPYDEVFAYNDGVAEYRRHVKKLGISSVFGRVFSDFGVGNYRSEGLIGYDNVKRGYIDKYGQIIIDSKNDKVYPMTPFGAVVENDGNLTLINHEGESVFPAGKYRVKAMNLTYGYLAIESKDNHKIGVKSMENGKTLVPFYYDKIKFLTHDIAILTNDKEQLVVNMKNPNNVLFKLSKEAVVTNYGTKGFMWISGDTILGNKYDNKNGYNGYKIIDLNGDVVFEANDLNIQKIGFFRHGISPVKIDGKWGIIRVNGSWLVKPQFKNIVIL